MSDRSRRYPFELHEEAFDLYSAGKPTHLIARDLQEKYGPEEGPSREAVRLWARKEGWRERREQIRQKARDKSDERRAEVMGDWLSRLYTLWDKLMTACEEIHFKATDDKPIRHLATVDRMIHVHEGRVEGDKLDRDDIQILIDHIFKVLYADEEVGPVLAKRRYQIDAALERARNGVVSGSP